jgi:hypothetical protein
MVCPPVMPLEERVPPIRRSRQSTMGCMVAVRVAAGVDVFYNEQQAPEQGRGLLISTNAFLLRRLYMLPRSRSTRPVKPAESETLFLLHLRCRLRPLVSGSTYPRLLFIGWIGPLMVAARNRPASVYTPERSQ